MDPEELDPEDGYFEDTNPFDNSDDYSEESMP